MTHEEKALNEFNAYQDKLAENIMQENTPTIEQIEKEQNE